MRAAMASKRDYNLFGLDSNISAAHIFPNTKFWQASHFNSEEYEKEFSEFLDRENIDLFFFTKFFNAIS